MNLSFLGSMDIGPSEHSGCGKVHQLAARRHTSWVTYFPQTSGVKDASIEHELWSKLLKGSHIGDYIEEYYRGINGNTRTLDCSSVAHMMIALCRVARNGSCYFVVSCRPHATA